jgi:TMEM175 potassium channel family protein
VSRGRLEAFSDAVLAVVITIMVLNLRPPAGDSLTDLRPLLPKLAVYLLSFVFVAIYWNNHHHMFQVVSRISGGVLWANAHLLFWLSLTPAAAAWLGPHLGDTAPTAVYGVVLLGSAIEYTILTRSLLAVQPADSPLARAIGRDTKGKLSIVAYVVAIAVSPVAAWFSLSIYFAVAAAWLVPDRRMERVLQPRQAHPTR